MPELADIFRACGPAYLAKYGERTCLRATHRQMLPSHKRAISDIVLCRTSPLGGKVYLCEPCDEYRYSYHSCKNRSCSKCGNDDATKWLTKQSALLLPVQYFMVTSTLPEELRPIARSNQKLIYGLLLRATAEAIQKLAQDPKFIGGDIGILAILQTWTRDMRFHPHGHFVVPGGGISTDPAMQGWLPVQRDYLMPERAVAKILRGKFRDALKKHPEVFKQVSQKVWRTDWVVNIKSVGNGKSALKYLVRYLFRGPISNKRIVRFKDDKVTFTYKDSKDKWRRQTLEAEKFMSRFLQHVLPKGFVKVRYYGFLSPRKRPELESIKELFNLFIPPTKNANNDSGNSCAAEIRVMLCPKCAKPMVFIAEIKPERNRSP